MSDSRMFHKFRVAGVTLVELVISIAVITAGITGTLLVINRVVGSSADPMVVEQSVAIAEAYMAEILSKDYDPGPGATRDQFDDVDDYNGLTDSGARGQDGNAIPGLEAYNVAVVVSSPAAILGGVTAKRVQVTVTGPSGVNIVLTGYRTSY